MATNHTTTLIMKSVWTADVSGNTGPGPSPRFVRLRVVK